MKFKLNYLKLLIFITSLFIIINLWYIIYNIYNLNNGGIVDTTTALQSLLSVFNKKVFLNTVPGGSYFSVHESFILYLLLPFMSVYRSFITLYTIQSILIYSAAIPIYFIALKHLKDEKTAFIVSLVYLFNPYIHDNPFETLTLFMGFIIYSFYFYDIKNYKAFYITFIISLSTIEFNPIIGGFFGLYLLLLYLYNKYIDNLKILIKNKNIKEWLNPIRSVLKSKYFYVSVSIIAISLSFYEIDKYAILYFSHGTHPISENIVDSNGLTFSGILSGFKYGFSSKINSIMTLNMPFLFVSLFDPLAYFLEFPWFFVSGISSFSPYWSPSLYYDSYIIPFAAISTVFGLQRLSSYISDQNSRTKLLRYLSLLMLFVTVILLISTSLFPMVNNPATPVNNNKAGIEKLASLIPYNQSVYTGVNELPIVSQYAPDTWFYGGPENYTLFNITDGAPYSLASYHFVAAAGDYALYAKNNIDAKFNDVYIQSINSMAGPAAEIDNIYSYCLPHGNYTLNLTENYSPIKTIAKEFNSENISYEFLNESYAIIYPMEFKGNITLSQIAINSHMNYGYYVIQSMITTSLDPNSTIASYSYGHNQYNFVNEILNYKNLNLTGNKIYYLWLWSSGDPGGMYYPVHNGTKSTYIAKIYNGTGTDAYGISITHLYNISSSDLNPQFTIYGYNNSAGKYYPSIISISINGKSEELNITGDNSYNINFNVVSNAKSNIDITSNLINGNLTYNTLIKSNTYKSYNNFFFEEPYIILGILVLATMPLFVFSIFDISLFNNFNYKTMNHLSRLILLAALIIYFILLSLYFYVFNMNLLVLKILGIAILISFVLYIISYRLNYK